MATGESPGPKFSEESYDYTCSVCTRKGRVSEAVKYCQVCQKYLCTSCLEHHNEYMEDHTLADPTGSTTVVMPTDNCERHVTEKVKMWCKGHNEVMCTICALMDHGSCTEIIDITTDISSVFKHEDLRNSEVALKRAQERISMLKNKENKAKENAFIEKNKYTGMVEEYQKQLISLIEALGKASIEEINTWYIDVQKEMEDNLKTLDYIVKHIDFLLNGIEANAGDKVKLFVTIKKGEKIAYKAESLTLLNVTQQKKFQMETGIEGYLSHHQSLGSIQSSTPRLFNVQNKREINVKTTSDESDCDIESTCVLSDGLILMTDRKNNKLKRLNGFTYKVTDDYCDMPETPKAVCCVEQKEVAVGLESKKIQFVSVEKTMTRTRNFVVKHSCNGIAYRDGELFVNGGDGHVHVYNLSGASLRTITGTFTANTGINVEHIAIDKDRLYITSKTDGLLCTDIQGKELYRYTDTKLSGCYGVSVDGCGGVFLSGYNTHNVVQFGADGKELGEILTKADGLNRPQSVCYDPNTKRLIVTCDRQNSIIVCDHVQN